jgi:hypothetical protein
MVDRVINRYSHAVYTSLTAPKALSEQAHTWIGKRGKCEALRGAPPCTERSSGLTGERHPVRSPRGLKFTVVFSFLSGVYM